MSIDANLPDVKLLSAESDKEIEVDQEEESPNIPNTKNQKNKNFGDSKYKFYKSFI